MPKINLYADDTAITVYGENSVEIENKLNEQLHHISTWFAANKLSLNHKKSNVMVFGLRPSLYKKALSVGPINTQLVQVSKFKYLGLNCP